MDLPVEQSHEEMVLFLKEAYLSGAVVKRRDEPIGPEKFSDAVYQCGDILLEWPHETYAHYGLTCEGWELKRYHALP